MKTAIHKNLWLITITTFTALLVPVLVQDGMFLDGITYASISHNLAQGHGNFGTPHYTQTFCPEFHGHPPLVFFIQSLFFQLSDSIYAERIYSFLTAILSLSGIVLLWNLFTENTHYKSFSWLPVLLWIIVPTVCWSYRNNMLENTLAVFCLFAVYCFVRYLQSNNFVLLLLGSFLILCAFLSKGFVGFFPLAVPIIYYAVYQKVSFYKLIFSTLATVLFPVFLFAIAVLFYPPLYDNITQYLQVQILPSLKNKSDITTQSHFYILLLLLQELAIPMALVLAVYFYTRKNGIKSRFPREVFFFLFIAVSASFPLAITLKQRGYYLVSSIPFYALAISFFFLPYVSFLVEKITDNFQSILKYLGIITLVITVVLSAFLFRKIGRDEIVLNDIYTLKNHIPNGEIIGTDNLCTDWKVVAYMCRINYYSLDCANEHLYFLANKNEVIPTFVTNDYDKADLPLRYFQLYKRKQ